MTQYTKPSVRSAWGQTAAPSDTQDPGDIYASKGWQIGVKPPRQYFNWVLNYIFAGVRYLCQQGVATWDASETYPSNAITITASGYLWHSLISNANQLPDSNIGSSWDIPNVQSAPPHDNSGRIANTSWVANNFLPTTATFANINGNILNFQVGSGAVIQWQGALTISP